MRYEPAVGHFLVPGGRIWAELVSGDWNEGTAYACGDWPAEGIQKNDLVEFSCGTDSTWPVFQRVLERGPRRHPVVYPDWRDDDAADWWKS